MWGFINHLEPGCEAQMPTPRLLPCPSVPHSSSLACSSHSRDSTLASRTPPQGLKPDSLTHPSISPPPFISHQEGHNHPSQIPCCRLYLPPALSAHQPVQARSLTSCPSLYINLVIGLQCLCHSKPFSGHNANSLQCHPCLTRWFWAGG